jgi:hypothetical protein
MMCDIRSLKNMHFLLSFFVEFKATSWQLHELCFVFGFMVMTNESGLGM